MTNSDLSDPQREPNARAGHFLLLASVFVIAVSGLIYELIAGALSSYLVGSSVTQFSLVIGLFMFAMGIGSYLSRFVKDHALQVFVGVEIAVGLLGGSSALLLFFAFTFLDSYLFFLALSTLSVGSLVGLEIPLVIRILRERNAITIASTVSSVLALDYVGALFGSLLFPLVLAPYLGLVRSGFLFGLVNVAVAGIALWKMSAAIPRARSLRVATWLSALLLIIGLVSAGGMTRFAEDRLYQDDIILAKDTPYQRIVVTRWRDDIRLYLNGHLQFSSVDEARYHEALVHPIMASHPHAKRVLVLGGGDGMTARELLKYPQVQHIDLVDLDPEMTHLFRQQPMLSQLNLGSLSDAKVLVHNQDAAKFLEQSPQRWDVAIVDLPDPNSPSLARLYAKSFYRLLRQHLSPDGAFVTQATSPFYAAQAFWCIDATVRAAMQAPAADIKIYPYHINVPSFGDWGFVLASHADQDPRLAQISVATKVISPALLPSLFVFAKDMQRPSVEVNHLDRPVLVRYYEQGWRSYND